MLIIAGPTGVGKSDFAETLARLIPAEIVNIDMGQCYMPLSIGTAKPAWQESDIPHHLFDIIDDPRDLTVTQYRERLQKTLENIWQRGKLPIVVGGSSFYLNSLFFPPRAEVTEPVELVEEIAQDKLWDHLYSIDPERAQQIQRNDTYRLKRALEIWYTTGTKPSEYTPTYEPLAPYHMMFLTRDRQELIGRINKRVKSMLNEGWVGEVKPLRGTEWEDFLLRKKIIGYDDILEYLAIPEPTEKEYELLVHTIAKRTRRYAKRQMTFWRMLQTKLNAELAQRPHKEPLLPSRVDTIDISERDMHEYAQKIAKQLEILFSKPPM